MNKFLLIVLTVVNYINLSTSVELTDKYEWKYIEYDWDSDEDKQAAIDSGSYVKGASLPVDVDRFIKDEIGEDDEIKSRETITFITLLRKPGVPATLTTVTEKEGEGGFLLRPYPDWSSTKNCSGYTNVYRIAINRCGQLWIVDSGKIDDDQVCSPKLTIIDLNTDEIVEEMEIPEQLVKGELLNIAVQPLDNDCQSSAAYIADAYGSGLIIWDGEKFCRLEGPEFGPEPEAEEFKIGDDTVTKNTGVLGLSLTPSYNGVDNQELFFRPLASFNLYRVNTTELRNYCTSGEKPALKKLDTALPSQSVVQAIDGNGILFYDSIEGTSLNCWNTAKEFTANKMVTLEKNAEKYQWVTAIKITPPEQPMAQLLVFSNRYQKFMNNDLNDDEVNFRILETISYLAVFGTYCY